MEFLFYLFSINILISAIMVIVALNPIHSVLFLVFVFFNSTGLLLLLQIEFLAMVFLVVYVGAIAVLFLFVIMLLNIKLVEFNENLVRYVPLGALIGLVFYFELSFMLERDVLNTNVEGVLPMVTWINDVYGVTNIELIGQILYTVYSYPFLMASLILLLAMVGAIVLTMRHEKGVLRQDIYTQVSRLESDVVTFKKTNKISISSIK